MKSKEFSHVRSVKQQADTLTAHEHILLSTHAYSARVCVCVLQLFSQCSTGSCGLGPASILNLKRGEKMCCVCVHECVSMCSRACVCVCVCVCVCSEDAEQRKMHVVCVSVGHVLCLILTSCLCSVSVVFFQIEEFSSRLLYIKRQNSILEGINQYLESLVQ